MNVALCIAIAIAIGIGVNCNSALSMRAALGHIGCIITATGMLHHYAHGRAHHPIA